MNPAIRVEHLSKIFRIGAASKGYRTLRETIMDVAVAPWRRLRGLFRARDSETLSAPTIWALKDISFEVQPGEVVGIIGRNGAGKSTLLKILSRVTEPTGGRAVIRGRAGSLLEVGTGFHPELSGRENIYLSGAILGMTRAEIRRKFEEIVAFSEIGQFLDTPVKRYSSGMYVRLAFAVAAHLEPEILIVDEVLSVGDVPFRKKCLGKMRDISSSGRTVLFVSHNMTALQSLCSRAVLLKQGLVECLGPTQEVVSRYLQTSCALQTERVWNDPAQAPGNDMVRFQRLCVRPEGGRPEDEISVRTPLVLEFEFWNLEAGACLNLSLHIFNQDGVRLFSTGPVREPVWHGKPFPCGLFYSACHIPGDLLNDGTHRVHLYVVVNQSRVIFHLEDALVFEVADSHELRDAWFGKWEGALRPNLTWETGLLDSMATKANPATEHGPKPSPV